MYYLHHTQRLTEPIGFKDVVPGKWPFSGPISNSLVPSIMPIPLPRLLPGISIGSYLSIIALHFSRDLPGRKPATSGYKCGNGSSVEYNREESWSLTHCLDGHGRSGTVDLFLMLVSETCSQH